MKKSTFLPKFPFFLHKIDIFPPKLILTETLVPLLQSLHDIILLLYLEIHSFAQKTDDFLHKNVIFLLKEKQRHQKIGHFQKREDIFFKKT